MTEMLQNQCRYQVTVEPGKRDGFSGTLVPAGDLWNKITAGSVRDVGEQGSPQGTAHRFPVGKHGPEPVENTPDAMAGGCV